MTSTDKTNFPQLDVAVVIGRWQIPHLGHQALFDKALECGKQVMVIIGSAYRAPDPRNPFSAEERQKMILRAIPEKEHDRIHFSYVRDYFDNAQWAKAVTDAVEAVFSTRSVGLVGFKKDETSRYLDWFSSWKTVEVEQSCELDATSLRNIYFSESWQDAGASVISEFVKPKVLSYLMAWSETPKYRYVAEYTQQVRAYKKRYPGPYYLTADTVLVCANHLLLIQRAGKIGRGQWALPGGFLNPNEQFLTAAFRELKEETQLALPPQTLLAGLKDSAIFDHPLRSPRGHLISNAFYVELKGDESRLPEVHAADDAMTAKFIHLDEVRKMEALLFEDHSTVINRFIPGMWY